jgi:thiamine-phosphate pyrophosphorylase
MARSPLLYYITSRAAFLGDERARRSRLLEKIEEAAGCGIDYIQLREKDMPIRELESLAREAARSIRDALRTPTKNGEPRTRLLINSRTDVALDVGADGVHLPAGDISPADVRKAWKDGASRGDASILRPPPVAASDHADPLIAISCHSPEEVVEAAASGAQFAVFAPVFEKKDAAAATPAGLDAFRQACRANIPVFALGGVTLQNAKSCLDVGAAGIAGIRLFQENDIAAVVRELHEH